LFVQTHSIIPVYQDQRGFSFFLMVDQGIASFGILNIFDQLIDYWLKSALLKLNDFLILALETEPKSLASISSASGASFMGIGANSKIESEIQQTSSPLGARPMQPEATSPE
jgi:hypothetical protein